MIDETKKYEAMFLKNLKERFQVIFSSFEKSKPLEGELNEIEELFRDPNLLIQSIKEMQQKQEESLNEFQSKLTEMNQVKDDLKATNGFKPNLSPFNQEDLFGSLKVNEFCSYMNPLKSQILKGEQQYLELLNLCEFSLMTIGLYCIVSQKMALVPNIFILNAMVTRPSIHHSQELKSL